MRSNVLFEKLRAGQIALGLANMYPAAGIVEGMCRGWDFVWIDGQHGQFGYDSMLHAQRAAEAIGVDTLLRVPTHDHGLLGLFADLSPSAVMVPMVNTPEQAANVVNALRFPPLGMRSYGGRRVIDLDGREFYLERDLLVVAQIETLEAVEHVDAIAATDGIDALFFGPDDMKVQMQIPVNTPIVENDALLEALHRTADSARKVGKFAGTVTPAPDALAKAKEMGYQLLVGGGDIAFLRVAAAERLSQLRSVIDGDSSGSVISSTGGSY